jgi:hypothetical protein
VITNGAPGGWVMRLLRMAARSDSMHIQLNYGLVRHGQLNGAGIAYFESLVQAE